MQDFGNDSVYHTNGAWLTYQKPGNYTLTLTVYMAVEGGRCHASDPCLWHGTQTGRHQSPGSESSGLYQTYFGYPYFNKVNVWVGVQQALFNHHYAVLPDGTFDASFFYKSPTQIGVDSTNAPISFQVRQIGL